MKKYLFYLIAFFLFIPILIFYVDTPLAKWIVLNSGETLKNIANIITKFGSFKYIVLMNILLIIFFYLSKNKEKLSFSIYGLMSQGITATVVKVLKHIFGRTRPSYFFGENFSLESGKQFYFFQLKENFLSFPSGHSAGIWAFIIFLLLLFKDKKYIKLIIIPGILIPLTRLILQFHFLSDILSGIIVASFVEYYLLINYNFVKIEVKKFINKINKNV